MKPRLVTHVPSGGSGVEQSGRLGLAVKDSKNGELMLHHPDILV